MQPSLAGLPLSFGGAASELRAPAHALLLVPERAAGRARWHDASWVTREHDQRVRQIETSDHPAALARHGEVVVLVEDDDSLRAALRRVLGAWGLETRVYASAEAALADNHSDWPDCLVVDVGLPGMSGLELIDSLRQRGVRAPVVVISAREQAQMRDEIRRRGIEHFLAKPFLGSELVRTVDAVLGRRQRARNTDR